MVLYICYNIKEVPYMNDLLNNNIKPKNTKELFDLILKKITELYNNVVAEEVRNRKNKEKSKMTRNLNTF